MPKEVLTENDDDKDVEELEIVEVDKVPTAEEIAAAAKVKDTGAKDGDDDHDEDDDGDEDTRLAEDHSDDGDDADSANRKKRLKRRQAQKEARDRTLRKVDTLEFENRVLHERLTRLEGATIAGRKEDIDERIAEAQGRVRQAETIHARAIEAGNGEDAVEAMRIRDEARDSLRVLEGQKHQLDNPQRQTSVADERIQSLGAQWRAANPWYDGVSEESQTTNIIDAGVKAEGYNPATPEYWEELTRRVKRRLGGSSRERDDGGGEDDRRERGNGRERKDDNTRQRREPPPMGANREHAPPSTRREVYVTPERKQAMQEAGIWDDPARRSRMLKAYADYDRDAAGNRS